MGFLKCFEIIGYWIDAKKNLPNSKEYSVILTTSVYDINQKIYIKLLISKISIDSNFTFTSYA